MCHYCGCRNIPLIRDYIAEHEQVLELGHQALREVGRGETDKAQETLHLMHEELVSHWRGEEDGVFALMREDELYREHIDPLIADLAISKPAAAVPALRARPRWRSADRKPCGRHARRRGRCGGPPNGAGCPRSGRVRGRDRRG